MIKRRSTSTNRNDGVDAFKMRYKIPKKRLRWIEAIYPYSSEIIKHISKIPWKSYKYSGETLCDVYDEETDNLRQVKKQIVWDEDKKGGNNAFYNFFGGSACELYAKTYPKAGHIFNYVSPTADLDMQAYMPDSEVYFKNNKEGHWYYKVFDDKGNYTNITLHYTKWLFNKLVNICKKIHIRGLEPPDINDTDESKDADMFAIVNNILICRINQADDNMVKLQLIAKFNNDADHFAEFIIDANTDTRSNIRSINTLDQIQFENFKVNVEPIKPLFLNQVNTMVKRFEGIKNYKDREFKKNIYKVQNHCGRIIYLLKLILYLSKKENEIGKKYIDLLDRPMIQKNWFGWLKSNKLESICACDGSKLFSNMTKQIHDIISDIFKYNKVSKEKTDKFLLEYFGH